MVEVYVANFSALPDPKDRKELMATLNQERRLRIAKAANEKIRRQCLASALLLQSVLRSKGLDPNTVTVNRYGKPEIEGICFNISHSGNLVVCAVSDQPIGCDIEKLREAPRKVSGRFFSEREKQYLNQYEGMKFDREFFRLWTMKEAYVKLTGEGLRVPFSSFEMSMGEEIQVTRLGERVACFIKEYAIPEYKLTVCATENEFAECMMVRL
jgi:4'-phosphopantetheinyl transferase